MAATINQRTSRGSRRYTVAARGFPGVSLGAGIAWMGTVDANDVAGIVKPRVLDIYEWSDQDWRDQRTRS